jgi:hypothetical protein
MVLHPKPRAVATAGGPPREEEGPGGQLREEQGPAPGNGSTPGWPQADVAIGCRRRSLQKAWALIQEWEAVVHPRADGLDKRKNVLMNIAKNLAEGQDPVFGRGKDCICWYGDTYKDEFGVEQGVLTVERPKGKHQMVFINRMLVFLFAKEECFDLLAKYPKGPFRMACKNQLCVNLGHIDTRKPPPQSEGNICRPPQTANVSRRPPLRSPSL